MVQCPPACDPLAGQPRYRLLDSLNKGTFGFVKLYLNQETSEQVAIKFLERGEKVSKYVEAEVLNHRMLRHPHIIQFREVFLTPQYICIVMEYASGRSLFEYVQRNTRLHEAPARWFFQQLIIGLDYCHRMGIFNRDIKLENTLLQVVEDFPLPLLKICDFGYSKAQFMSAPKSKVGTIAYMAPEVVRTTAAYDGACADIWSCGIMLYVMLFGVYPFDAPAAARAAAAPMGAKNAHAFRHQAIVDNILAMRWSIPDDASVSPECRDLLARLIVAEPGARLPMADILRHPWFTTNLPAEALTMNNVCVDAADYTGLQSVEEIRALLAAAAAPPPGHSSGPGDEGLEDMINEMCAEELMGVSYEGGSAGGGAAVS